MQLASANDQQTAMAIDAAGVIGAVPTLQLRKAAGTHASPQFPGASNALGAVQMFGWGGSAFGGGAEMLAQVAATTAPPGGTATGWSATNQGTRLDFSTVRNGRRCVKFG